MEMGFRKCQEKPLVQNVDLHEARFDEEKEKSKEMNLSVTVSMKEEDSEIAMNPSNNESKADINNYKDEPIEVNIHNHFEFGFPSLENNIFNLVSKYRVSFKKYKLMEQKKIIKLILQKKKGIMIRVIKYMDLIG